MARHANSKSWRLMLHVASVIAGRGWRRHMKNRNVGNGTLRGIYDRTSDIRAAGIEDNLRQVIADAQKDNRQRYWARDAELTALIDVIDQSQHDREYLRDQPARRAAEPTWAEILAGHPAEAAFREQMPEMFGETK